MVKCPHCKNTMCEPEVGYPADTVFCTCRPPPSNVRNIRADLITPLDVIQSIQADLPSLAELYVIGITKDGTPMMWAAGTLKGHAFALAVMQQHLNECMRVDHE